MRILTQLEGFRPDPSRPLVLAIGNFDGIHRGHQKLIGRVLERAKACGGQAGVLTFREHPQSILHPEIKTYPLTSPEHKLILFREYGLDLVFLLSFTRSFSQIKPEDFIKNILVRTLNIKELYLGYNAHFGHNREGDASLMHRLAQELDFHFEQIPAVKIGSDFVSSTRIRKLVGEGQIQKASDFLGRPFSLFGKVIHGAGRGKGLGYPTANLEVPREILPPEGVYPVRVRIFDFEPLHEPLPAEITFKCPACGPWLPGVIYYGRCPTFETQAPAVPEVFIFDYTGDLYQKSLEVAFFPRLRGEMKFENAETLKEQIRSDIENAKRFLLSRTNPL